MVGAFCEAATSELLKLARSAWATLLAMSPWIVKMFCAVSSRSYYSAQIWRSVGASTSCTVTRTWLPARCT